MQTGFGAAIWFCMHFKKKQGVAWGVASTLHMPATVEPSACITSFPAEVTSADPDPPDDAAACSPGILKLDVNTVVASTTISADVVGNSVLLMRLLHAVDLWPQGAVRMMTI